MLRFVSDEQLSDERLLLFLWREFHGIPRITFRISDLQIIFYSLNAPSKMEHLRFLMGISLAKIGSMEFSSKLLGQSALPWDNKWFRVRSNLALRPVYMSVGALVRAVNYLELNIEGLLLENDVVHQSCSSMLEIAISLQSLPLVLQSGLSAPREGSIIGHSPVAFTTLFSEVYLKMCQVDRQFEDKVTSWNGSGNLHIGIVGGSFDGMQGRLIIGLLESIPESLRHKLELVAVCFPTPKSAITDKLTSLFDRSINLPDDRSVAIQRIRDENFRVLLFSDANYDTRVFALAHERLAPIQAALWGWGSTIGLGSLDYFFIPEMLISKVNCPPLINSKAIFPLTFFQEQVIRLDGFPSLPRMTPLNFDESRRIMQTRYFLDISNQTHVYLVPISAKQLHPEFDRAIEVILSTDPAAMLIIAVPKSARDNVPPIHAAVRHDLMHPSMALAVVAQLKTRLSKSLGNSVERVRFLPPMEENIFRALQIRADVVLDSFPVGLQMPILDAFRDHVAVLSAPMLQECVSSYGRSIGSALNVTAYQDSVCDITLPTSAEEFGVLAVRIVRDVKLRKLFTVPSNVFMGSRSSHMLQICEFVSKVQFR